MSRGSQTIRILSRTRRSTAAFRSSRLRRPERFQAKWITGSRRENASKHKYPEPGSQFNRDRREARTNERPRLTVEWATLIGRVADGDREAFRHLFEHFAPRVKGVMLKTGASSDDAEEIAQETLLAVWRKAAQFDPVSAGAAAWIFTIARNLRIDQVRRAARTAPSTMTQSSTTSSIPPNRQMTSWPEMTRLAVSPQRCRASPRSNPWRSGCRSLRNVRIPRSRTSSGYRWAR